MAWIGYLKLNGFEQLTLSNKIDPQIIFLSNNILQVWPLNLIVFCSYKKSNTGIIHYVGLIKILVEITRGWSLSSWLWFLGILKLFLWLFIKVVIWVANANLIEEFSEQKNANQCSAFVEPKSVYQVNDICQSLLIWLLLFAWVICLQNKLKILVSCMSQ